MALHPSIFLPTWLSIYHLFKDHFKKVTEQWLRGSTPPGLSRGNMPDCAQHRSLQVPGGQPDAERAGTGLLPPKPGSFLGSLQKNEPGHSHRADA